MRAQSAVQSIAAPKNWRRSPARMASTSVRSAPGSGLPGHVFDPKSLADRRAPAPSSVEHKPEGKMGPQVKDAMPPHVRLAHGGKAHAWHTCTALPPSVTVPHDGFHSCHPHRLVPGTQAPPAVRVLSHRPGCRVSGPGAGWWQGPQGWPSNNSVCPGLTSTSQSNLPSLHQRLHRPRGGGPERLRLHRRQLDWCVFSFGEDRVG